MSEIDQLRADLASAREEIARLRGALEPFVGYARVFDVGGYRDEDFIGTTSITVGHLRRARAALSTQPSEEEK